MNDGLVIDVNVPNYRRHSENSSDLEQAACTFNAFNEIADKCRKIELYNTQPVKVIRIEITGDSRFEKFKVVYRQDQREFSHEYSTSQFHDLAK